MGNIEGTLHMISDDFYMTEFRVQFQKSNFCVGGFEWENVRDYVTDIMKK